jgi:hypothetical protein
MAQGEGIMKKPKLTTEILRNKHGKPVARIYRHNGWVRAVVVNEYGSRFTAFIDWTTALPPTTFQAATSAAKKAQAE